MFKLLDIIAKAAPPASFACDRLGVVDDRTCHEGFVDANADTKRTHECYECPEGLARRFYRAFGEWPDSEDFEWWASETKVRVWAPRRKRKKKKRS